MAQEKQSELRSEAELLRLRREPPGRLTLWVEKLKRHQVQPVRLPVWGALPAWAARAFPA